METITRLWNTPSAGMFTSTISGSISLHDRQEDALGRLAEPVVLLRRAPDDGGRIDRPRAPRDRREVEHGVVAGQRVVAGVVAERALEPLLGGVDVALQHDLGLRRHLEVDRAARAPSRRRCRAASRRRRPRRCRAAAAPRPRRSSRDRRRARSRPACGRARPRRSCSAPPLWICQCMPSVRSSKTCSRYMPTLRAPVRGSRVKTPGSVM